MKKLIITIVVLFSWILSSSLFAQTATNKIQNMATMMLTNSTLYVGGTNTVLNGTRYQSGEILTIFGIDGAIKLVPLAGHHRVNIYWVTNSTLQVPTWTIGQDLPNTARHTWGIQNIPAGTIPFLIASNVSINIDIPTMILSSNLFVSNSVTMLGTNNARYYKVDGVRGMTLSITNIGPSLGSSNVEVFAEGLLTNKFTIP